MTRSSPHRPFCVMAFTFEAISREKICKCIVQFASPWKSIGIGIEEAPDCLWTLRR